MNKVLKFLFVFTSWFTSFTAKAQNDHVEMATGMYQSGKIYVVIGVISIIFIGIILYLIIIDRKVSKLEKELKNK